MFQDHKGYESLLFGIQRSVRYHDRRIAHFEWLHKITNVLTILLSGIVFVEISGTHAPDWLNYFAASTAILGAGDLVIGYSRRANQHHDLKRRFIALERRMLKPVPHESIEAVRDDRLIIESEEPPIFRALDGMCHNELLTAKGYDPTDPDEKLHFRHVPRHKRLTANWLRWPNLTSTAPAAR